MGLVTTTITFGVPVNNLSYGYNGSVLSVTEFKDEYLWGIPLCNPVTNQSLPDYVIQQKLLAAQKYVENMLDIKIFKQYVLESKNFNREEYMHWGYVKASWMVNTPYNITGVLGGQTVLQFPSVWVTTRTKIIKDDSFSRNMYFVPNGQGSVATFAYNVTINNLYAFYGSAQIPEYWQLQYLTGFEIIPADVIDLVGKQAAVELLTLIEMTVSAGSRGMYGSASASLGLDGMSQSTSRMNGGNIFQKRIQQYQQEIQLQMKQLKMAYTGITFDVL